MVKNLQVNYTNSFNFSKIQIHDLVNYLRNELEFELNSLLINFISSIEILEINVKYLGHNYFTDIITFNYSEQSNILDGELYISYEEAENNAKKYRVPSKFEYFRLVIHGILHLLGYDDQNKNAKLVMKRLENNLLKKFLNQMKMSSKINDK